MSTARPAHKAKLGFERNPTNDVVAETSSKIDYSAMTEFAGVTSVSVSTDGGSTTISQLGQDGVQRLLDRSDLTIDVDVNLDLTNTNHQNFLLDSKDESNTYSVGIDFDSTQGGSDRFGVAFVGKVDGVSGDVSDGAVTATITIQQANGADYKAKTATNSFTADSISPHPAFRTTIAITGDPVSATVSLSDIGNGTTYVTDAPGKDIWDPSADVTVREDTTGNNTTLTSGYTEEYLNGRVEFNSSPTDPVEADVDYFPFHVIDEASEFSFESALNLEETPYLGDRGQRRTGAHYDFTADYSMFDLGGETVDDAGTEDQYFQLVQNEKLVVVEFKTDTNPSTPPVIRAIGKLTTDDKDTPQGGVQSTSITFEGFQRNKNSNNLALPEVWRFKEDQNV